MPGSLNAVYVNHLTLTSALGAGLEAMRQSLEANQSGLQRLDWPGMPCYLGAVDIPSDVVVPAHRLCRINRLIEFALQRDDFERQVHNVIERYGSSRVGVVLGSSNSSLERTEEAYRSWLPSGRLAPEYIQPRTLNPHGPSDFLAERFGVLGPCMTVSAACASSSKVFAVAQRWLAQHLVDAVIIGGVDALCLSVIYGFSSLQLVADEPCRPFAIDRRGINLGEAAGFAILSREPAEVSVLGVGESSDAYHMSSAHPDGLGAELALHRALTSAQVEFGEINYVNLHGTGTRANDEIEGKVCARLFDTSATMFSATKGWTGHTLGAAGMVEAVLSINAITTDFIPGTMHTTEPEQDLPLMLNSEKRRVNTVLSNSFGFGGTNCSVVLART